MSKSNLNIVNRRAFLSASFKTSMAVALSTLVDIPFVMKRALAEGNIGLNGKKILFIWLRGANDALNSVVPIEDPQYALNRPTIALPKDTANGVDYTALGPALDPTTFSMDPVTKLFLPRTAGEPTFAYDRGIALGNGYAALHPSLKFLVPVYNAGDLALIHRVAYPKQSRSHFDSQNYWENGNPNKNLSKDGIFYRTIIESGLANTAPLTGVSIQSALPLILRGSGAAMTNLTDPTRYDLLGVPSPSGDAKALAAIRAANNHHFPGKRSRELLDLQYENMSGTLSIFSGLNFSDADPGTAGDGNTFVDDAVTDGDAPYYLFPTRNRKNGGAYMNGRTNDTNKYVVPTGNYSFFTNLKAAAMILNNTDAIIAGTEIGGFDTHQAEGAATGSHANLQRSIGWAMYALKQYFTKYGRDAVGGAKVNWNDVVVITLSEFGRTSVENTDRGTDHAEAGVMLVAGGNVKGYGKLSPGATGVFGIHPSENLPWIPGPRTTNLATCGTMFAANTSVTAGYLRRSCDYRSVLGEIIREHLGSTQGQLDRIIPGYANPTEYLMNGGTSSVDGVSIRGEVGIL